MHLSSRIIIKILVVLIIIFIALFVFFVLVIKNTNVTRYSYKTEELEEPVENWTNPSDTNQELDVSLLMKTKSDHITDTSQSYASTVKTLFEKRVVPNPEHVTIMFTGDFIPARSVNSQTITNDDFTWAISDFSPFLKSSDYTIVNFESPLLSTCPVTNEGMIFCGSLDHIEGLKEAGVDLVSMANNHISDYGKVGIYSTTQGLLDAKINHIGIINTPPVYTDIKGTKFAFVAFNDVGTYPYVNSATEENIESMVGMASENAELVIAIFHWGDEYTHNITDRQQSFAHLAIESGADVVLGNHSHWIQPAEYYQDKLILYSHGNFIFDQMWSEKTREGMISTLIFEKSELVGVDFSPTYIVDYGKATVPSEERSNAILENFKNISIVRENKLRRN